MDKEATNRGTILVNPEVVELKGGVMRNSTGNQVTTGSHSLPNSGGKILPRYLRPSMGSCHDLCKYGKKEALEMSKYQFPRSLRANNMIREEEQNQVENLNLLERRKRAAIKLRASSQLNFLFSDTHSVNNKKASSPVKIIGLFDKQIDIKLENSSPTQKSIVSAKQAIIPKSPEKELSQVKSLIPGDIKKGHVINQKTTFQPKNFSDKPKVVKRNDPSAANEIDALGEPKFTEKNNASIFKKSVAHVKPYASKREASSSVEKRIPSAKTRKKASSPLERVDLSVKPSLSLKRKTAVVKPVLVVNTFRGLTGRRNQEAKISKTLLISKIGGKKVFKPSAASLSPQTPGFWSMKPRKYMNGKSASPMEKQEKVGKVERDSDGIKEGTLLILEPESENVELDLIRRNSEISPSRSHMEEEIDESESSYSDASESVSEEEAVESSVKFLEVDKKRHRRTATVYPIGVFPTLHKLRFRRGKVVELQPESNGPRRLRFRRGRVVGERLDGDDLGMMIFKRGEIGGSVSSVPGSEAQTVVLRHQDMQGKKDPQGLFNHVIEQTATKLVESRKSKVKALVGAFETVISLQDSKQTSTI